VTATTLRAQPTRLARRGRSGGDAQELAATNPVAALPCARTLLLHPLAGPLLHPLLQPSSATVGAAAPAIAAFQQVRESDPGRSRAKTTRDRPGSLGKLKQWRATRSGWVAGAVVAGRPPTNTVGASRRAAVITVTTLATPGGRMGSRQRPRWGTGPAPTHRDVDVLAWVAEQYAVRADTLGLLLGRRSPETPQAIHRWQYAPASRPSCPRCRRRRSATTCAAGSGPVGCAPSGRLGGPGSSPPARPGLELAGSGYRLWTLVPSQLQHLHAVAVVRLAIECANPEAEWVSERALTRLRAQRRETWWRPDGGLIVADAAVSGGPPLHTIEVELTPKHLAKLQEVFEHRYPGEVQTTYFTPPGHQDGLRRRLAALEQATRARNDLGRR
jgi:hypothetical protein